METSTWSLQRIVIGLNPSPKSPTSMPPGWTNFRVRVPLWPSTCSSSRDEQTTLKSAERAMLQRPRVSGKLRSHGAAPENYDVEVINQLTHTPPLLYIESEMRVDDILQTCLKNVELCF